MFFCLILFDFLFAQDTYILPKIFENSPNSASFVKFGNYKVNTFTGIPDISIPLYEIKAGDITVPITLRYHASGLRVTESAGWAGLGWSLEAGGSVTRKVMGQPDEANTPGSGYLAGYLKPANYTFNTSNESELSYLNYVRLNVYDTDPDIFSYNFPGKSGNFFFNGQNGFRIIKVPYSPVKIVKYYTPGTLYFDITDETGNFYRFGQNIREQATNTMETTSPVTAWMLEKIISQSGKDTVTFTYTSESYSLPGYGIDQVVFRDRVQNFYCNKYSELLGYGSYISFSSFITDQKPSEIKYNGGKVVFVKSVANRQDFSSKKLDTIKIYNFNYVSNAYKLIRKIVFHTSYFSSTRLKLDSLSMMDNNGVTVEKYRFAYNVSTNLPAVNSKAQDYWGFYNGRTSNTSLVPETVVLYENGSGGSSNVTISSGNNRDCDSTYMQANILTRIYYPSGGFSEFEYQTNKYLNDQAQVKQAGGLRIKSIKSYESSGSVPVTYNYIYGPGRANFLLSNYYFVISQDHRFYSDCGYLNGSAVVATMRERVYRSFPSIDLIPFDGSIVVYPRVTEYVGNGTSDIGKTVYKYMDHADGLNSTMGVVTSRSPVIESYADQRGHLLEKADFKNVNNMYLPVLRETYLYNTSAFADTSYAWVGFCCDKKLITDADNVSDIYREAAAQVNDCNSFEYTFYRIRSDDNYLTSKTIKTYDQVDTTKFLTQTTTYAYSNSIHQQVTDISSTDSKGQSKVVYLRYPADYAATTGFLKSMTDRNMHAVPVERYTKVNNYTVAGRINGYRTGNLGAIVQDYVKTLELSVPFSGFTPTTAPSGSLVVDSRYTTFVTFDSYDSSNNLTKYTPRTSSPVSVIWGYRNLYPIAKIVNSANQNFAYTGFESGTNQGGWSFTGTPVVSPIPKAGTGCYYLPNGSVTKTISSTGNYRLQFWARSPVTLSGGTITDVTSSSPDQDGWVFYEKNVNITSANTALYISGGTYIDEVRLFPAASQIISYTYEPHLGISSLNDENGVTTYYEFDNYGRLKFIRNQDKNILQNFDYRFKRTN